LKRSSAEFSTGDRCGWLVELALYVGTLTDGDLNHATVPLCGRSIG
jgi:hypothetical protein